MNRNYFFVVLAFAIASLLLTIFSFWNQPSTVVNSNYIITPPSSPCPSFISGVGIVEPISGNIFIGTPVSRIVEKVLVNVGDKVKKGDILFELESNDLKANLNAQEMAYKGSMAKLKRLESLPRPEELSSAQAALNNAQAELDQTRSQYEMIQGLSDPRAISKEEREKRLFGYKQAQAKVQVAQADLDKIKSGTWEQDLEIARYETKQTEASTAAMKTEVDRTVIRSPIDGTVLQVKIHPGEFTAPDTNRNSLMIIGNIDEIILRVNINQLSIPYFKENARAVAYLQGDGRESFPLEFLRLEPYLVPKQNLTNDLLEQVDTRVLQVIYRLKKNDPRIFVGERMDAFICTEYPK